MRFVKYSLGFHNLNMQISKRIIISIRIIFVNKQCNLHVRLLKADLPGSVVAANW